MIDRRDAVIHGLRAVKASPTALHLTPGQRAHIERHANRRRRRSRIAVFFRRARR